MKVLTLFLFAILATIAATVISSAAVPVKLQAPKITSSPAVVQPGQWIYVNGESWSTTETVKVLFQFDSNNGNQEATCITYGNTSLGCTVPANPPSMNPAKLFIVTESGGQSSNFNSIVVAAPAGAPKIRGVSSPSNGYNCYLYVSTSNAFVGTHTKPDDATSTKFPNTQIFLNGNIEVAPTVYQSDSIGITIPRLVLYSDYTQKTGGNVTISIRTKLGSHTSTDVQYRVKNVDGKGNFC